MGKRSGLYINSLFALPPNTLQLCGSRKAQSAMEACASGGDCTGVEEQIKTFRTLWPYMQYLAFGIGCEPFDVKPAESYWMGNPAIYHFDADSFEMLLKFFGEQPEIPKEYIELLRANKPKKVIPFHTFQVLLSAKNTGGINEAALPGINNCMVSWGVIKKVDYELNQADVLLTQMEFHQGRLKLKKELVTLSFNPKVVPNLMPKQHVAAHWGTIVMKISLIAEQRLIKATDEVLKIQFDL